MREQTEHKKQSRFTKIKKEEEKNKEQYHSILVFNLSLDINQEDLKTLFQQYGEVKKIHMYWVPEKMTTFNAKIYYKEKSEAQQALNTLNGAELDQKNLKIIFNQKCIKIQKKPKKIDFCNKKMILILYIYLKCLC